MSWATARDPGPCAQAGHRGGGPLLGRRRGLCRPASRETELAERLGRLLPGAEVVRFATSGTEAVLMAMRLARAFTGRDKILKFEATIMAGATRPTSARDRR